MMDEGEPSTSNPEQQLPNGSKRNGNGSNVDPLDCRLLPELPPKKEEGIWRLKIEYLSIEESDAYRVCLIWMNVAKNQAIIPDADVITDPAAREREQLREGLIGNPFVEETERTKREKESWSPEEEKQLCSALKRNKQDFSEAAKLVPNKTQAECVAYWHHYENLRLKRKRDRKLSEEAASPPKKSRSGRTIKTPRRFSEGAKERRR
ncbi:hypothetical protein AWC38_SpisGene22226 [Stylophora pistillata]|uniref:Uncharacterized protein n=1 Tax=Stylophora pistillata TaxID=50429 RepID=A0A2B4R7P6_STYPI|nr:hypothetical protein AWC38_SpisGene22226 [Stylophora pistillata]